MLLLAWLDTHQDRISAVNGPRSLNFTPFYESYQVETLGNVTWLCRFNKGLHTRNHPGNTQNCEIGWIIGGVPI